MTPLAQITQEILDAMRGCKVVECGAGSGDWVRALNEEGIDCIGYDLNPGDGVMLGDHLEAAAHADRAMLIVWPPDGAVGQAWIDACKSKRLYLCASRSRHRLTVNGQMEQEFTTAGYKGLSYFRVYNLETTCEN